MTVTIELVTRIAAAPAMVFALDVDVHAASLAGGGETATTSSGRRRLGAGDEVTFQARHFGLPWRMTSRISVYEPPGRFVDERVRGPFRALRHEHLFEPDGDGTRMADRLTVTAPLGLVGVGAERLMLAPYLRRLLLRRADHIERLGVAG